MATDIETVIIGAGVIGLATARALCEAGHEVMVLERHDRIGAETSSRNSEVIHAGIYYPPGSERARLCVRGRDMLYAFAGEYGVPAKRCGKLVVATDPAELAALDRIAGGALKCGVSDLKRLSESEARALEPELKCVAGLLSPSTGIIDVHAFMLALEGLIGAQSGEVVLNTSVEDLALTPASDFAISFRAGDDSSATITARNLVISAGLEAQRLSELLLAKTPSAYRPPKRYLAKAHYYTLSGRAPFRHLIYPIPHDGGLGIHLTLDIAGQARFGPDLTWVDHVDYTFDDEGGARRAAFEEAIRRYWPGLPRASLQQGYTGIRPKIHGPGTPTADFAIHGPAIHGVPRLVGLYGVESPGITSSLAIAEDVAAMFASGSA